MGLLDVVVDSRQNPTPPHCIPTDELYEAFGSSPSGLPSHTVEQRSLSHGRNTIDREGPGPDPIYKRFFLSFKEPIIALLVASAFISLFLGEFVDALSIMIAICFVNLVGIWQEYKSEKSIEALGKMAQSNVTVRRDNDVLTVSSCSLVVGDLVLLHRGDRIPADLRIISSSHLQIDESLLTGEQDPVHKVSVALPLAERDRPLSERENMAFMGTAVVSGSGVGLVVGVGKDTELGHISALIQGMDQSRTPLQDKMDEIGKALSAIAIGIIVVIVLVGVYQNRSILSMLNIGVSLAVAAIPEGLPIVVTITLAVGVTRMAGRHVIVRSLPVVEGLGSVGVICTDKTGTLTKNQMDVEYLVTEEVRSAKELLAEKNEAFKPFKTNSFPSVVPTIGSSLNTSAPQNPSTSPTSTSQPPPTLPPSPTLPSQNIFSPSLPQANDPHTERLLSASILCNGAIQTRPGNFIGQPTDIALLRFALDYGVPDLRDRYRKVAEEPFTSQRKMACVEYDCHGLSMLFLKGATEKVLEKCDSVMVGLGSTVRMTQQAKMAILEKAEYLGEKTLRVIAVAEGKGSLSSSSPPSYSFLGLLALRDPLKEGVMEAVQKCMASKVRVIILTGDGKETAESIAKELGLMGGGRVSMSAQELDAISELDLSERVGDVPVFYRVTPEHKLKIVNSLIAKGEVVAMTGDGVNDAPALKRAHVGVAMGQGGSDVAKEAAQMILVDDNFASIYAAILEGKAIFTNILSFLRYQLTTSISCLLIVFLSSLMDLPAPMNPTQILWINILMDGPPAQSLGMEPLDPKMENSPPRQRSAGVFSGEMLMDICVGVVVMVMGTILLFYMELMDDSHLVDDMEDERRARTMAFNTFVCFQIFNAFNCKSHTQTFFRRQSFGNFFFWLALSLSFLMQMGAIYFPGLQTLFQTTPLTMNELFVSMGVASSVLIVDEIGKFFGHKRLWKMEKSFKNVL